MKVAHLVSSSGLYGAERVLLTLASKMGSSLVVSLEKPGSSLSLLGQEARKLNIPFFRVECRAQFDNRAVKEIQALLAEHDVDVVHSHNYKANLIGFMAARPIKRPIVATVHGYLSENAKVRFYEAFDRGLLRFFSRVVLVSEDQEKWFRGYKTTLIHNGIDVEAVGHQQGAGPVNLGIVGRLSQEKGHARLFEALVSIKDVELLVAGDGPLRSELEEKARALGISSRIKFLGFQSEIGSFYKQVDICVCASLLEHFPMVVLEAMARGKAVIATRVGDVPVLIKDAETGLLVEPGSSVELAGAIRRLLADPALRDRLGENARKFVSENYSSDNMVLAYDRVYEKVMAQ